VRERERERHSKSELHKIVHFIRIEGEPHKLQSGEFRSYFNVITRGQKDSV
jgi:hypothetical protein